MSDFTVTDGTYYFYGYDFDTIIERMHQTMPDPDPDVYRPALKYAVFGVSKELPEINREIPNGLEIGFASEEFKAEQERVFGEYMTERYGALWTDALKTENWAVIFGDEIEDGGTLHYLVNTVGIIETLAQSGTAIFDPMTYRLFTPDEWHRKFFAPLEKEYFDPCLHAVIVTDKAENGTVRMRTLGMRKFGRPDAELINIPDLYYCLPSAHELLNNIMSDQINGICYAHKRQKQIEIHGGMTLCLFYTTYDENMEDDFFHNKHIVIDDEKMRYHDNDFIGCSELERIPEVLFMTAEEKFEKFRAELENEIPKREQVTFEPYRGETTLFSSKLGGKPYFPRTMEYPQTKYSDMENVPLIFLAQINFSEIPHIEGFPEKGILQFYIDGRDSFDYGLPAEDHMEQSSFRVIYHEEILPESEIFTEDELPDLPEDEMMPFTGVYALKFGALQNAVPALSDCSLENAFIETYNRLFERNVDNVCGIYAISDDDEEFWDVMYDAMGYGGSCVGGYPYFTQDDPRRDNEEYAKCDTLLLQIDSDEDILWGDLGVANFFINSEDLKNRDFSRVLYNWDCC